MSDEHLWDGRERISGGECGEAAESAARVEISCVCAATLFRYLQRVAEAGNRERLVGWTGHADGGLWRVERFVHARKNAQCLLDEVLLAEEMLGELKNLSFEGAADEGILLPAAIMAWEVSNYRESSTEQRTKTTERHSVSCTRGSRR